MLAKLRGKEHFFQFLYNVPKFQEYTPEMRNIQSGKPVKKENSGVILTRQTITSDDLPTTPVGVRSRPMSTVGSVHTAQSLPTGLHRAGSYESSQVR